MRGTPRTDLTAQPLGSPCQTTSTTLLFFPLFFFPWSPLVTENSRNMSQVSFCLWHSISSLMVG